MPNISPNNSLSGVVFRCYRNLLSSLHTSEKDTDGLPYLAMLSLFCRHCLHNRTSSRHHHPRFRQPFASSRAHLEVAPTNPPSFSAEFPDVQLPGRTGALHLACHRHFDDRMPWLTALCASRRQPCSGTLTIAPTLTPSSYATAP
jgi:hypothetical protein